ncbi:MAG: hypothetical protein ACYS15_14855 [Planctomycetota bacterium]
MSPRSMIRLESAMIAASLTCPKRSRVSERVGETQVVLVAGDQERPRRNGLQIGQGIGVDHDGPGVGALGQGGG